MLNALGASTERNEEMRGKKGRCGTGERGNREGLYPLSLGKIKRIVCLAKALQTGSPSKVAYLSGPEFLTARGRNYYLHSEPSGELENV